MQVPPFLSIVIPVYNGGAAFVDCLLSIKCSTFTDWELIVVDDSSEDKSALLAEELGAILLYTGGRLGPGAARNLGAQAAQGLYLCFVDADCEVLPETLTNLVQTLKFHPEIDALFGSYDDQPKALNLVAQYKNLFHHYVHQHGNEDASTFWTGCGTIRRALFLSLGGFDVERYQRPSIEDIDLGYRIKQAGGKICLAKNVQVKHHKAWTLFGLIKTDVLDRGIPWTRLMLSRKFFSKDLNLETRSRVSVVAIYLLLLSLGVGVVFRPGLGLALALGLALLGLNQDVYGFFWRKRGVFFTLGVIPLHWLYYFYSGIAFTSGLILHQVDQTVAKSRGAGVKQKPTGPQL